MSGPATKIEKFPQLVEAFMDYLGDIQEEGWSPKRVPILKDFLHNLEKLAKCSDHVALTFLVSQLQETLTPILASPSETLPSDKLETLHALARKLKEAVDIHYIDEEELKMEEPAFTHAPLLICLKDKVLAKEIIHQVKYFGYQCISCDSLDELFQVTKQEGPFSAILLDIDYCLQDVPESIKPIAEKIPLIFIAANNDVTSRLFAVQAGGQAYLVCPLEFTSLIEKIDQLATPVSESIPYRILIIEDSTTQANIIRKHLEEAHMTTEVLEDPLKISDVLIEFQPDLILLDLYMPQCSGMDLARVIRQQDLFMSIPIVYLSVEEDANKQLNAIKDGGDDFLTKPLTPQYLTTSVKTRAKRYRSLRAGMIQDSLTGLLNHTRILEQLDLEMARAHRNNAPLSFAMIDIDHFKNVNDSHGHPVGDRVIKGLARLLKQRLRKTDIVGRYGGEEFALILPQSQSSAVVKKLDEIRRGFSKLLHRSADPTIEFSATFSIGLAQLNKDIRTVDQLVQAADQALYLAKEEGRNCIVIYQADKNNSPPHK
jgi:diguanylate cyclase (GGDEF)-like protein